MHTNSFSQSDHLSSSSKKFTDVAHLDYGTSRYAVLLINKICVVGATKTRINCTSSPCTTSVSLCGVELLPLKLKVRILEDDDCVAVTVATERYLIMLQDFFLHQLRMLNVAVDNLRFQQDGTIAHRTTICMDKICDNLFTSINFSLW